MIEFIDEEISQGNQSQVVKCKFDGKNAIIKSPNSIEFTPELERDAWQILKQLNCINFCEVYKILPYTVGSLEHSIVYEEISIKGKNYSLHDIITNSIFPPHIIYNCIMQTMGTILMMEQKGITHYDLHTDNIMIKPTPYDVHVYKIGNEIIPIVTFGITPVIIDFGMSHIKNHKYKSTSYFANIGVTNFMSDPFVDSRVFLRNCTSVMTEYIAKLSLKPPKQRYHNFKDVTILLNEFSDSVKKIFSSQNIVKTGWFKDESLPNIFNLVQDELPEAMNGIERGMFGIDFNRVVDLLQYDISLPLKYRECNFTLEEAFAKFAINWFRNVEPIIRNTREEMLFLKNLIMLKYGSSVQDYIRLHHRYPEIKNLVRLRRDLRDLTNAYNNFLLEKQKQTAKLKRKMYAKMEQKSTLEIFRQLPKLPNQYFENMTVHVMNSNGKNVNFIVDKDTVSDLNKNEIETIKKRLDK
ncbi:144L [Cherax quadricarinatus iridovirus]|uniref:Phosphotransferase n=1 Tax=Shrimp hemocyte iridescent virus TaxID=2039780 RepID=A0A291B0K8_9VIRU|nr:144L [Cherax quadricarinatus iridovirus]YP_010084764.1 phosphotransferase [Shrimp hemocyte iridescent virus]UPA43291.1 phosphotransferase [Iridovirus CN01]ASZ85124.1 144L [Cherax quadricarinatus iridovirus]ATE87021.1 phosphotransferase [Shrimp hemocyte iridescent virus]UPA43526.1 phosphotransferase [Iridovirus CN01]UPA43723.1 phosphotransferase [Iridovirus CN01]